MNNMANKISPLLVMICILLSKAAGQLPLPQRITDLDIQKFNVITIEINPSDKNVQLFHIDSILVVDARPDTLSIGLAQNYNQKPYFINSFHSFSVEAEKFVNNYIIRDGSDSLSVLMVVKKFWVCGILKKDDNQQLNGLNHDTVSRRVTNLQAKIEFYLKNRSDYYILYRFDSTLVKDRWASQDASELVEATLRASLSKLIGMSPGLQNVPEGKRKFSWDEIELHYNKRFDIPILRDSILVPGVYLSFDDFKNNQPTQKNFELSKDKLTALIFIRQPDGKLFPVKDAWGYCDGRNLFIRSLSNYFLLQRRENSFYIYGSKEFGHKTVFSLPNTGAITEAVSGSSGVNYVPGEASSEGFNLKLRPFELDWDDGRLK
jgi:hypothetical protein